MSRVTKFKDKFDELVEKADTPYKIKPNGLLNIYKHPDRKSKVIGCMSTLETGTVNEEKDGLGFIAEKRGWINLSKVKKI